MRHGKKFNHLSRKAAHRKALLMNLANALVEHKRIKTTLPKAKALRKYVEPLITRCKEDTMNNRRVVFKYLQSKDAIKEMFGEISSKVADRPGGYTRIIKLGHRRSDDAPIALIELVDYNETMESASSGKSKGAAKKKRTRRGRKKKTEEVAATETAENATEAQTTEETTEE